MRTILCEWMLVMPLQVYASPLDRMLFSYNVNVTKLNGCIAFMEEFSHQQQQLYVLISEKTTFFQLYIIRPVDRLNVPFKSPHESNTYKE